MKLLPWALCAVAALAMAAFAAAPAAHAATWRVTKLSDTNDLICDADCSLREAVLWAMPGDTFAFASPLFDPAQTITLTSCTDIHIGRA